MSRDARALHIPVNVVDNATLSTVIFTALVERPPLWFAISSDGRAPLLARYWRHRLEEQIAPRWGAVVSLMERFQTQVRKRFKATDAFVRFWERVLDGRAVSMVCAEQDDAAHAEVKKLLDTAPEHSEGEVWLVGAGPGDPDLLTLAAARCLQRADVVCYDRLVSDTVLDRIRRDARRIAVGKSAACRTISQEEINQVLVEQARAGYRVVRLKGGDPFVFARGGEELEYLAQHNIPFTVVPGISAANGCACYAGIPLTDRRLAHSVRFLSGHTREGKLDIPWSELLDSQQTLVFYMSSQRLGKLGEGLLQAGRDPGTLVALVEQGTTPAQRVTVTNLKDLPTMATTTEITTPTLLIVGNVVRLRKHLAWYGSTAHG